MECPRAVEWHGFMITRNCLHPRHRKRLATAPSGGCIDISSLSEVSRVRIHLLAGQQFCFHPPPPSSPSVCPLFGSVFQSDLRVTAASSLTTFSVTNRFISSSIIFPPRFITLLPFHKSILFPLLLSSTRQVHKSSVVPQHHEDEIEEPSFSEVSCIICSPVNPLKLIFPQFVQIIISFVAQTSIHLSLLLRLKDGCWLPRFTQLLGYLAFI